MNIGEPERLTDVALAQWHIDDFARQIRKTAMQPHIELKE